MAQFLKHVLDVVRSDMRILTILTTSTGVAAFLLHHAPDSFASLPAWVQPAVLLAFVLTASALSIGVIWALGPMIWRRYVVPWRRDRERIKRLHGLRESLLQLSLLEVALISRAVAESRRALSLNSDAWVTIALLERGIIRRKGSGLLFASYEPNFEISDDAWLLILGMEEFHSENPRELGRFMDHGAGLDVLTKFLPKMHPTVAAELSQEVEPT